MRGEVPAWAISGWVAESDDIAPVPHIILPHAEASIAVLQRGNNMQILVCGPAQVPRIHQPCAGERLIGISLSPETMTRCFDLHPPEWEQKVEPAPPSLITKLEPALEAMRTLSGKAALQIWIDALAGQVACELDPQTVEHYVASQMRARHGNLRLSRLSDEFGLSSRQMRRRFIDLMGISPKTFARQLRLAKIMARADQSPNPDWADLAYETGYCDQSHFVRECRSLTSHTPSQIHTNRQMLSV
jgi:AraC-like DNA-binding protein